MSTQDSPTRFRVLIAGRGVGALETLLALGEPAPQRTAITMLAPIAEFVHRPMTVREPFSYPEARHYSLAPIVCEAGAELIVDTLAWVDPAKRTAHTSAGAEIEYDA